MFYGLRAWDSNARLGRPQTDETGKTFGTLVQTDTLLQLCLPHSLLLSLSRTLSLSILGLIFIHLWHVIKEVPHKLIRPKSKQIHVPHNPTFVPLLCIQRVLRIHIYIYMCEVEYK